MPEWLPRWGDLEPLLPGVGAALLLLLIAGFAERRGSHAPARILALLALPAAFAWAWYVTRTGLAWPALQASERGAWCVAAFTLGGGLVALSRPGSGLAALVRLGLAGSLVLWLLRPLVESQAGLAPRLDATTVLLLTCGVTAWWYLVEWAGREVPGSATPLTFGLVLAVGGQVVLLYGTASLAALAGATGLVLVAAAPLARWLPSRGLPPAIAGPLTGIVAALGLDAFHFSVDVPPLEVGLILAGTPLLLGFSVLPGIQRARPALRAGIQVLLVVLALAAAFWLALDRLPAPGEVDDLYGPK